MSLGENHTLTIDRHADLDAVIGALDAFDIRVVCVAADVDTVFGPAHELTVRPRVDVDLPAIDHAVRRASVDVLDLRTPAGVH